MKFKLCTFVISLRTPKSVPLDVKSLATEFNGVSNDWAAVGALWATAVEANKNSAGTAANTPV